MSAVPWAAPRHNSGSDLGPDLVFLRLGRKRDVLDCRDWHLPELQGSSNRNSSSGAKQQFWDKGFLEIARWIY